MVGACQFSCASARAMHRVHRTKCRSKVKEKTEESSAFPVRRRNIIKTLSMTLCREVQPHLPHAGHACCARYARQSLIIDHRARVVPREKEGPLCFPGESAISVIFFATRHDNNALKVSIIRFLKREQF